MERKKVAIEVCTGTLCHVMGGSELHLLVDHLTDQQKEYVSVKGCTCIGACKDQSKGKAPFVKVDGKLISEASVPKVINYLKTLEGNDVHKSGDAHSTGAIESDCKTIF